MNEPGWQSFDLKASPFFNANAEAFIQRFPDQFAILQQATDRLSQIQVRKLGPDQWCCSDKTSGAAFYTEETLRRDLQQHYAQARGYLQRGAQFLIMAGAGFNYLASHLLEDIRGNMAKGILLVERRSELVLASFALMDCTRLIQSNQVYWALGDSLADVVEARQLAVVPRGRSAMIQERVLSPEEREDYRQQWMAFQQWNREAEQNLNSLQVDFMKALARPPVLEEGHLWGYVNPQAYAHTPLGRAFASGFADQGWKTTLLETEEEFTTRTRIGISLYETKPDLLLFLNSPSNVITEEIQRPRITLVMDNPAYLEPDSFIRESSRMDSILYMERSWEPFFRKLTGIPARFMPVYPSVTRPGEVVEERKTPLVFVGSHRSVAVLLDGCTASERESLEAVAAHHFTHPGETIEQAFTALNLSGELLQKLFRLAERYTDQLDRIFPDPSVKPQYFLYALANGVKRERFIGSLLDLGIHIYGPDGWLDFLGSRYAHCFRGWLNPSDLPDVYASADVCINLHSLQCPTCMNVRDFDVLHSGGCLLGDWVEDMESGLVQPGEDCIIARTPEAMRDAAIDLLENEQKRERIRQQGNETCLTRNQPGHRVADILPFVLENWRNYSGR